MNNLTPRLDRIDRNYFINGAMEYFQVAGASVGVAVPSSYDYSTVDMFELEQTGTWTSPESVRSTTKVGSNSRRSLEFTGTPGAISDEFHMRTKIESIFAQELVGSIFSLGLRLKSSNFTQVRVILSHADVEDDFTTTTQVTEQTINFNADSTEQDIRIEALSSISSLSNGIQVDFEFKGLGDTSATTLNVGEFILNIGNIKNEYAPFGRDQIDELSKCRRYFEKTYDIDTSIGTSTFVGAFGHYLVANVEETHEFKEDKRIIPIVTYYNNAGTINTLSSSANQSDSVIIYVVQITSTNKMSVGFTSTGQRGGHYTLDARL